MDGGLEGCWEGLVSPSGVEMGMFAALEWGCSVRVLLSLECFEELAERCVY